MSFAHLPDLNYILEACGNRGGSDFQVQPNVTLNSITMFFLFVCYFYFNPLISA